ncbi:DUF938 domain-containing protein [Cyanobacterium stanieri LEGE 03274]|uniref:DUF938 domain-containing protein n=1 Tax=Cyanobacterium stanieri LEGE 03274 TaxID=1828756 RepID=A0ABR9V358_9CHRO|nr:DUF938 domain-containing protein [Cyanobacterium stanieri]MBE9222320.1 DUF938 domain-containing protein [Cyanobacterium stanieri LEGE 03274]
MKQFAPATLRNREPILKVLKKILPSEGGILEISSGTGEHCVYFAPHFPGCIWIPSDINEGAIASITAWKQESGQKNIDYPLMVDVTKPQWYQTFRESQIRAIVCINMIHIAPWDACIGLMAGAGHLLHHGDKLYLYGPYKRNNQHTALSNEEFDQYLQSQNRAWGVRNMETVVQTAEKQGLHLQQIIEMPSNNFSLIFEKQC